jgi:3-phenylpropionate/trans-cinnamate dioxygenase ferredoxin subunit
MAVGRKLPVALEEKVKKMSEFMTVGPASLSEGDLKAFEVGGVKIAVANVAGALFAFGDTCTHRQCPLSKGELEDTTVTPCHGSQFDVTTGAVLSGPAEDPVGSYPIRVEDDAMQIEV